MCVKLLCVIVVESIIKCYLPIIRGHPDLFLFTDRDILYSYFIFSEVPSRKIYWTSYSGRPGFKVQLS